MHGPVDGADSLAARAMLPLILRKGFDAVADSVDELLNYGIVNGIRRLRTVITSVSS